VTGTPASAPSSRPVSVAVVLSDGLGSRGGIGRVITYLVAGLAEVAPDIAITAIRSRLTDRDVLKHLSVPISLARFAARNLGGRFDVVHINIAPRGSTWRKMLYAAAARAMGCKVLLHLHGSGYDEYIASLGTMRRDWARRFFQRADKVVALSDNWRRFVIDELGVPADRVVEIANGVPAADPPAGPPPGGAVPRIAFFGVVGERKGTDVLLAALGLLQARGIAFEAVIGGNGEVAAAQAQAQALGLAEGVRFLGWVDSARVDQELRQADLLVLPSRAENQPVSILEAMARGRAVVATRIGAIPTQVSDGETGTLVAPGDAAGLADALAPLLGDPALCRRYGEAGLRRFEAHFSVRAAAERFAALYRELAER
jgi:glycosyltransferase involved in cell wall biosynthesis